MFVQCTGLHGLAKQDGLQNKVFSPKKLFRLWHFRVRLVWPKLYIPLYKVFHGELTQLIY